MPTMGYCLGGTLAAMHAARHPEQVSALVLLGAPIDFHRSGVMAKFTDRRWFDADVLADAFGNIPPTLLQSAADLVSGLFVPITSVLRDVLYTIFAFDDPRFLFNRGRNTRY